MKKILIAEDNLLSRELLKDILTYDGYEILEAEDGETAVEKTRLHKPGLVFMDIQMPVMDGYAAIRNLRRDPVTKEIPIVVVTSFAMKGDRDKALAAGADEYISKPFDTRYIRKIAADAVRGGRKNFSHG
ncbi:MAG: response regulator [Syntrophales bacterium]